MQTPAAPPAPDELTPPVPLAEAGECDLADFACGESTLDNWLRKRAREGEGRYARTFVVLSGGRVAAYYCLSAGSVPLAGLPSAKYRRGAPDPVPVLVLGRMAVDKAFQRQRLGKSLVRDCFQRCLSAAEGVGFRALVVHPLNDGVVGFYKDSGFMPMATGDALFMPIETIEKAFAAET